MSAPKLLMIAYIFPPLAGAGVYRTLKFAKYLPDNGIAPVVVCADDPDWYVIDDDLLSEIPAGVVVHRVAPKPTLKRLQAFYRVLAGRPTSGARVRPATTAVSDQRGDGSARRGLKRRILDRLGVPDEQVYWRKPAATEGLRVLGRLQGDVCLYSTGPPFSGHLVALDLKRKSGVPWIADFRDAWAGNPVFMDSLDPRVRSRHERLERSVIEAADLVLCAAPGIRASLVDAHPRQAGKVRVLTNGFDPADFNGVAGEPPADRLVIAHLGELSLTRDPAGIMRAVAQLAAVDPTVPIELLFVGHRDPVLAARMDALTHELGIEGHLSVRGPVSHADAIAQMKSSHVLLFQSAFRTGDSEVGRTYPGKVFEYMAAGRPVLGIVPGGEAARLIEETGCGWWRAPDDVDGIAELLGDLVASWRAGKPLLSHAPDLGPFDRRRLAAELANDVRTLLGEVVAR